MHLITVRCRAFEINPLNAKLNPICHLLALLGAHPILHVSRIRIKGINILTELSEKSSLTLYQEIIFYFDRRMYTEWCLKKEKNCNSVATSRGVAIERNKKKYRQNKVPIMFG
jgi:hypothetical protein